MKTIYFGGGTPSLFPADRIADLLGMFDKAPDCEVTIEIDPGTFTMESLAAYRSIGFTRFSMGVQTLNQEEFASLGRGHSFD